jgi:hypothetical protein
MVGYLDFLWVGSKMLNEKGPALVLLTVLLSTVCLSLPVSAQTLQGRIETEDYRIKKERQESLRIGREMTPMQPTTGSPVDSAAFAGPLTGKADDTALKGSAVDSGEFAKLPKGFDIGADKGSKELVLAWEKWHKQLAGAIYQVWNGRANSAGRAVLKITVYRNRTIVPEVISCTGGPGFLASIKSVFRDINGNPGLTFPSKSERDQVSFEAEYIAGTNVDPGYSWLKGDVEKIHKDY